jgi:hypothetical protein
MQNLDTGNRNRGKGLSSVHMRIFFPIYYQKNSYDIVDILAYTTVSIFRKDVIQKFAYAIHYREFYMLSFYKNTVPILIFSGLLAGCTSTGDIQKIAPNVFQVSTAACPACGGTSKSMELALQKANSHCAAKNQDIVVNHYENESLNLAGAGGTSLEFRCIELVDTTASDGCYGDLLDTIATNHDLALLRAIIPKIATRDDGPFGFEALTNSTYATLEEKEVLMALGAGWSKCDDLYASTLMDAEWASWSVFARKRITTMADLSMGNITYSEFAKAQNSILEQEIALAVEQDNRRADSEREDSNARSLRRIMIYDAVINN